MGWYLVYKRQKKMLKKMSRFRRETESRFLLLNERVDALMAVSQDIKDLCVQLDAATNDIAAEIQKLVDQIGSGVSPADAADIQARLSALKDRLVTLGKDPANPVPAP